MFGYHKMGLGLFGLVVALALAGCGAGSGSSSGSQGDRLSEGERLFGGTATDTAQDAEDWSIGLMVFADAERRQRAIEARDQLRSASPVLADAFVADRGDRTVVLIGGFPSPSSREALELLDRVRGLRVQGEQPFRTAFFVPPIGGRLGDLDLRNARRDYNATYTLQVGAYGRADATPVTDRELREIRESAEEAARRLRREGELAFYYHGPSLSMVTVGAFGERDIELGSLELVALRERFPHNLLNGRGIRQRVMTETGQEWVMQPSFPVEIPE